MRRLLTALASALVLVGTAEAALVNMGDGTVKDTTTNLIWLEDWSLAGREDWDTQMAWAQNLTFAGSGDWQLPTISQYLEIQANAGSFSGLQVVFVRVPTGSNFYWTNTEDATVPGTANYFKPNTDPYGAEGRCYKSSCIFNAVALRYGDVAVAPEPATLAVVGAALAGVMVTRRRKTVASTA